MTSHETKPNIKNQVKKIILSCFSFLFKTNLIAKIKIKNLTKPIDLEKELQGSKLMIIFKISDAHKINKI